MPASLIALSDMHLGYDCCILDDPAVQDRVIGEIADLCGGAAAVAVVPQASDKLGASSRRRRRVGDGTPLGEVDNGLKARVVGMSGDPHADGAIPQVPIQRLTQHVPNRRAVELRHRRDRRDGRHRARTNSEAAGKLFSTVARHSPVPGSWLIGRVSASRIVYR